MFQENAHSVAMILHAMNIIKSAVHHVNPEQVPVVTLDQPLFAIAKQIQWNWPDTHGKDKFVIVLGGLHIEMAAFKVLGDWLDGSGWTSAIVATEVASGGVAVVYQGLSLDKNQTCPSSHCCMLVHPAEQGILQIPGDR